MAKKDIQKTLAYKDYLLELNKSDVTKILDTFQIDYKKNQKKEVYVEKVLDNVDKIVSDTLDIFQMDEYHNIKLLVKKNGKITIRINYLLGAFLENLERNKLIKEIKPKTYIMPKELVNGYKRKLKNKTTSVKIKETTYEYALIKGFVNTYGVIDFNRFYDVYSKKYKLQKDQTLERISFMSAFYEEIRLYESNNKKYLSHYAIKNLKACNAFIKKKGDYAVYTIEELISIYDFSFLNKCKSYKAVVKFIKRNYNVEKSNFKIINNYILSPFLTSYQQNREDAMKLLSDLIDKHFEFKNQKHKNKFMDLIEKVTEDYPSWSLKGYTQRG